jgi:hypothetical protein
VGPGGAPQGATHRILRRAPGRWKTSRVVTHRALSREHGPGGLGSLSHEHSSTTRESDRGVRGTVSWERLGSNRPLIAAEGEIPRAAKNASPGQTRRSDLGVVKHPLPWSCREEPRVLSTSTRSCASKAAEPARNARGTGTRSFVSGGRRRSDASRVLVAEGSQGSAAHAGR